MQKGRSFTSPMQALRNITAGGPLIPNVQGNELAGEVTLQFQISPPADALGVGAIAVVTWKVGDTPIRRVMSVYSGAAISGVADAVDVKIQDVSGQFQTAPPLGTASVTNNSQVVAFASPVTLAPGTVVAFDSQPKAVYTVAQWANGVTNVQLTSPYTGPTAGAANATSISAPYVVTGTVGRGTRPTTSQPPVLLLPPVIVATGSPVLVQVPQDSGVISAFIEALPLPATALVPLQTTDIVVIQQSPAAALGGYYPLVQTSFVPMLPGVTSLFLVNNSATEALISVCLGVEG